MGLTRPDSEAIFFSPHTCGPKCGKKCVEGKSEVGRFERIRKAKAICAGCLVREPCLEYALEHRISHGVWGASTERERRLIIKRRNGNG